MSSDQTFALLAVAAETVTDLERVRIATENRARALTHPEQNICLPEDDPTVKQTRGLAEGLEKVEHKAALQLAKTLRASPLGEWISDQVGIGEKQAGRLLGVIGHPRWRWDPEAETWEPRTIAQLWAYCGYHVVDGKAPKRARGEQGNWNTEARTRTYLIAESCIKQAASPYRRVYEEAREKYADARHNVECVRCGPSGKPAPVGSELSDGHKHMRAMRIVAKEILRDLWLAAAEDEAMWLADTNPPPPLLAAA